VKYKLTFALVASLTSTAFAAFQAPLPEFKNEKQLAEWRAEKAAESTSQGSAPEEAAFYTGKPYLASSGGYAFKYRSYNPEMARWTSEDPSGFPDGSNNTIYGAYMVLRGVDPTGEKWVSVGTVGVDTFDYNISNWGVVASGLTVVGGIMAAPAGVGFAGIGAGLAGFGWSVSTSNVTQPVVTTLYAEINDSWVRQGYAISKDETKWTGTDVGFLTTTLSFTHTVVVDYHWGPLE
jgi:RHS repeat-associated protein